MRLALGIILCVGLPAQQVRLEKLRHFEIWGGASNCFVISADARLVLCGGEAGDLVAYRVADGARVWSRRVSCYGLHELALAPDGASVAVLSHDLSVWRVRDGEQVLRRQRPGTVPIAIQGPGKLAWHPGGRMIAWYGESNADADSFGVVEVVTMPGGRLLSHAALGERLRCMAFAGRRTDLRLRGRESRVIWDWRRGVTAPDPQRLAVPQPEQRQHLGREWILSFDPQHGLRLASRRLGGAPRLRTHIVIQAANRRRLRHDALCLDWSGRFLALGADPDRSVTILDLDTGTRNHLPPGHRLVAIERPGIFAVATSSGLCQYDAARAVLSAPGRDAGEWPHPVPPADRGRGTTLRVRGIHGACASRASLTLMRGGRRSVLSQTVAWFNAAALRPDGAQLAWSDRRGVRLIDERAGSWSPQRHLPGPSCMWLAYLDKRRLLGSDGMLLRVWASDGKGGSQLLDPLGVLARIGARQLPDQRLATERPVHPALRHIGWPMHSMVLHPRRRILVLADGEGLHLFRIR